MEQTQLKLKYRDLVMYMKDDKEQLNSLKVLSHNRDIDLKYLVGRGVFCVPDEGEIYYLLEQWGLDFEEVFGKDADRGMFLVNEGFIIPVLDSERNIVFYINYNWERSPARKYLNIFPDGFTDLKMRVKMFGMHNMAKGIKEGWMVVVEGVFDVIRLESVGIPAVALMGNKLTEYHKRFLSRFDRVVYIPDTDSGGEIGKKNVLKGLSNAVQFPIEGLSKDVDEFAVSDPISFNMWVEQLKYYKQK